MRFILHRLRFSLDKGFYIRICSYAIDKMRVDARCFQFVSLELAGNQNYLSNFKF